MLLLKALGVSLLAIITGTRMPVLSVAPGAHAVARDSEFVLTAAHVTHYLALKQALRAYWQDTTHDALRQTAEQGQKEADLQFPQGALPIMEFDYSTLVAQNTELATLFTANQLTPATFAAIQNAVMRAVGTLYIAAGWHTPLPASSTHLGQNVALVKRHKDALAAVGVTAQYFTMRLTPDLLTRYLAVKKALLAYWQAPAHKPLRAVAKQHILTPSFVACTATFGDVAHIDDYPTLIRHDPALAALFKSASFAPALFAGVQVAAWQAMLDLTVNDLSPSDCPLPSGVVQENVVAVRGVREALEAAGIIPTRPLDWGLRSGAIGTMDAKNGGDPIIFYTSMSRESSLEPHSDLGQ